MREAGLVGASHRRGGPVTTRRDAAARPAPDLVYPTFAAEAPDRLWVADITLVPTAAGFLYLAVVLDTFSRKIVGWTMASHLRTELVLHALNGTVGQRRPRTVIHGTTMMTDPLDSAASPATRSPPSRGIFRVERLTRETFALFGDVIDDIGPGRFETDDGEALRIRAFEAAYCMAEQGRTRLRLFRLSFSAFPGSLGLIQRHPNSSEMFVPLGGRPSRGGGDRPARRSPNGCVPTSGKAAADFLVVDRAAPGVEFVQDYEGDIFGHRGRPIVPDEPAAAIGRNIHPPSADNAGGWGRRHDPAGLIVPSHPPSTLTGEVNDLQRDQVAQWSALRGVPDLRHGR